MKKILLLNILINLQSIFLFSAQQIIKEEAFAKESSALFNELDKLLPHFNDENKENLVDHAICFFEHIQNKLKTENKKNEFLKQVQILGIELDPSNETLKVLDNDILYSTNELNYIINQIKENKLNDLLNILNQFLEPIGQENFESRIKFLEDIISRLDSKKQIIQNNTIARANCLTLSEIIQLFDQHRLYSLIIDAIKDKKASPKQLGPLTKKIKELQSRIDEDLSNLNDQDLRNKFEWFLFNYQNYELRKEALELYEKLYKETLDKTILPTPLKLATPEYEQSKEMAPVINISEELRNRYAKDYIQNIINKLNTLRGNDDEYFLVIVTYTQYLMYYIQSIEDRKMIHLANTVKLKCLRNFKNQIEDIKIINEIFDDSIIKNLSKARLIKIFKRLHFIIGNCISKDEFEKLNLETPSTFLQVKIVENEKPDEITWLPEEN